MPPKRTEREDPPSDEEIDEVIGHTADVDSEVLSDPERSLREYGFALIKVFDQDELRLIAGMIDQALTEFPEYNSPLEDPETGEPIPHALGGFAAFGNPGSYHHPTLNLIRLKIYQRVVEVLQEIDDGKPLLVEMLLDRLAVREKGQVPPKETWHRDVTPTHGTSLEPGDVIYGGFTNLNSDLVQAFSCVPATDQGFNQFTLKAGFADIPEKFHDFCKRHRYQVKIPPGHHIIFPQHIVHEIVAIAAPKRMYRMFVGLRTRRGPAQGGQHVFGERHLREFLREQAVPKLPSGQKVPIFAANHQRCWKNKPFLVLPNGPKMSVVEWLEAAFTKEVKDRLRKRDWPVDRFLPSYERMGLLGHFPLFGAVVRDCLTLRATGETLESLREFFGEEDSSRRPPAPKRGVPALEKARGVEQLGQFPDIEGVHLDPADYGEKIGALMDLGREVLEVIRGVRRVQGMDRKELAKGMAAILPEELVGEDRERRIRFRKAMIDRALAELARLEEVEGVYLDREDYRRRIRALMGLGREVLEVIRGIKKIQGMDRRELAKRMAPILPEELVTDREHRIRFRKAMIDRAMDLSAIKGGSLL
jgi:hypothetical protein